MVFNRRGACGAENMQLRQHNRQESGLTRLEHGLALLHRLLHIHGPEEAIIEHIQRHLGAQCARSAPEFHSGRVWKKEEETWTKGHSTISLSRSASVWPFASSLQCSREKELWVVFRVWELS
eukprot:1513352-Rhodomonas_salina.3